MEYYCDIWDKTYKIKKKGKQLHSLTHIEGDKGIKTKHIKNSDFFDIDEMFNKYITNHKKIDFNLLKYDFKIVFDK